MEKLNKGDMVKELSNLREAINKERDLWRVKFHEELAARGLKVSDVARFVSTKNGKGVAQLSSLLSVCNIKDDMWDLVLEFFESTKHLMVEIEAYKAKEKKLRDTLLAKLLKKHVDKVF